jgi:hypothetical protein
MVEILEGPDVLAHPRDEYTRKLVGALDRLMPEGRTACGTGSARPGDHYEPLS